LDQQLCSVAVWIRTLVFVATVLLTFAARHALKLGKKAAKPTAGLATAAVMTEAVPAPTAHVTASFTKSLRLG
jgi:hypothetical protein